MIQVAIQTYIEIHRAHLNQIPNRIGYSNTILVCAL